MTIVAVTGKQDATNSPAPKATKENPLRDFLQLLLYIKTPPLYFVA